PSEWGIAAGPVSAAPAVTARVAVSGGGVALLYGFQNASNYALVVFRPGLGVELLLAIDGQPTAVGGCTGERLGDDAIDGGSGTREIALRFESGEAVASIDGVEHLRCAAPTVPTGPVGLGVLGAADTALRVDSLSIRR